MWNVLHKQGKKRMKSEKCLVNCLWVCEKHIFLSNVKSMIYIFEDDQKQYEKYESCHDDFSILLWKIKKGKTEKRKTNMLQSVYYEVYVIHVIQWYI